MGNRLRRFPKSLTLVLGATTLLCLPGATRAQSAATQSTAMQSAPMQDRQAIPDDDITRRDLARFDQFLDSHREIADQLRRTPSLIDDPQFLQSHPELNAYLQEHPNVKQEISEHTDTFMRLEDLYGRDANLRDRDAGGLDRGGNDRGMPDRDTNRAEVVSLDRFLDEHREIAEQVRKDPSLLDNRRFVQNHPALQAYLQDNPGVRELVRQDPTVILQQDRDATLRDRDGGGPDRDVYHANAVNFDRFLNQHREIAEQVRKDPSLCGNRDFVQSHPALQAYLQDNPGVLSQLRQAPNAFMQQDPDSNVHDRDPVHDRMADFGGFLGTHSDIHRDLLKNPSAVKNPEYVQNHAELNAWLSAHPDVRDELMANPQNFVQGAQQYNNDSATGGAGLNGRGTNTTGSSAMTGSSSMTGSSTTRTSTSPTTAAPSTKPNPNQ